MNPVSALNPVYRRRRRTNQVTMVLATLAGVAYGWVYQRTGRITASALTHAAVDWVWKLLFRL